MVIVEAHAQTAEAAKAAANAGAVLLDRGVLGAVCVLLAITVGVLFWFLLRAHDRHIALLERAVGAIGESKTAQDDTTEAVKVQTTVLTALTKAVETLSREGEGDAKDTRHALENLQTSANAIATRLQNGPPGSGK